MLTTATVQRPHPNSFPPLPKRVSCYIAIIDTIEGRRSFTQAARRSSREEEEAERLYEEAVGQASSEQQAVQGLDREGADGHTPRPIEDVTNLGEEQPPPGGEEPTRPGYS